MPAPEDYPDWATSENYSSGVHVGEPTKIEPTPGLVAQGHYPGKAPGPQPFNWWRNLVGLWVRWFDEWVTEATTDISNLFAAIVAHGTRLDTLEDRPTYNIPYDVASVSNELGIEEVSPTDVRGHVFRLGTVGSTVMVVVYYRIPVEPNSTGTKYLRLPMPSGASWAEPPDNFASALQVWGSGTFVHGVEPHEPVHASSVSGGKLVQLEWKSDAASGTGFITGSFCYEFSTAP